MDKLLTEIHIRLKVHCTSRIDKLFIFSIYFHISFFLHGGQLLLDVATNSHLVDSYCE